MQAPTRHSVIFGLALALGTSSALADYTLQSVISIPTTAANVQPGGAFTSFDISYFDAASGNYYVADRSNASVDIVSGTTPESDRTGHWVHWASRDHVEVRRRRRRHRHLRWDHDFVCWRWKQHAEGFQRNQPGDAGPASVDLHRRKLSRG